MSSASRKLKRVSKKKLIKKAKNSMKDLSEKISQMPKACSSCGLEFNNKEHLDSWKIIATQESLTLLCPNCQEENNVSS